MGKKVNITKRLRKISHNRIDDPAPNILFKYCKGANDIQYKLGKGLGVFVKSKNADKQSSPTIQDKQMIVSVFQSFLKRDKKEEIILPKKERYHRMDISSYNYYLEKHFSPDDFDIDEHFLENEIYHFSVNESDLKNYVTETLFESTPETKYHLISVSMIYKDPFISMLIEEGCDWKNFMTNLCFTRDELSAEQKTTFLNELKNNPSKHFMRWSDKEGAKKNLATKVTFAKFNWKKMIGINPYEEYEEYTKCFELFSTRHSSDKYDMEWIERPQEHLKRWVWIPSYFNYYIRKRRTTPTKRKGSSTKSWTRKNYVYKGERKIPIQVVYTPSSLRKRIQKRVRQGGELRETGIRGYWRRLVNPHSLGKDKSGDRTEIGRTWIKPHTRMIWFKGETILVKVPFKDLLSISP